MTRKYPRHNIKSVVWEISEKHVLLIFSLQVSTGWLQQPAVINWYLSSWSVNAMSTKLIVCGELEKWTRNTDPVFGKRRRRWPNIKQNSAKDNTFCGRCSCSKSNNWIQEVSIFSPIETFFVLWNFTFKWRKKKQGGGGN